MTLLKCLLVICSLFAVLISAAARGGANAMGKNFSMVLVGGGLADDNDDIWGAIVDLAGGKGKAKIGVIAAAGENPCCDEESSFYYYKNELLTYGAAEVIFLNLTVDSKAENENPQVVSLIQQMSGFFFTGGDQQRIIYSLYNDDERVPSAALRAIKEQLFQNGGVVAGTSAGTDCQTINTMISGGDSYDALVFGAKVFWRSAEYFVRDNLTAYGPGGIGLFTHGLLDTHFANRGRIGRLLELLVDTRQNPVGSTSAFGIDENTAMIVTGPWGDRVAKAVGERGILVLDISKASLVPDNSMPRRPWSAVSNVKAHRLSTGDVIDLDTLAVTPAPFKQPMAGKESRNVAKTSLNVFEEGTFEFDSITQSLFDSHSVSTWGLSKESKPQVQVIISRTGSDSTLAQGFDGTHPSTGSYAYSYTDLAIDINFV